jgi:hypothetical protein
MAELKWRRARFNKHGTLLYCPLHKEMTKYTAEDANAPSHIPFLRLSKELPE